MKYTMIILIFLLTFYIGVTVGANGRQQDIENRANVIEQKECYTDIELEYILIGGPQT